MRQIILLLIALLSIKTANAENNDAAYISFFNKTVTGLLPNFRYPQDSDLKYDWKAKDSYVYKTKDDEGKHKAPYWTKGLFNNDEVTDYVYILISNKDNLKYTYAFLSKGKEYEVVLLDNTGKYEMGLATQDSGKVVTASGKGYWKPTEKDPPEVNVKRHAIAYFKFESAGSIFLWDDKNQKLNRHWTSD